MEHITGYTGYFSGYCDKTADLNGYCRVDTLIAIHVTHPVYEVVVLNKRLVLLVIMVLLSLSCGSFATGASPVATTKARVAPYRVSPSFRAVQSTVRCDSPMGNLAFWRWNKLNGTCSRTPLREAGEVFRHPD